METTEELAGGLAHDSDDALAVAARTDPDAFGLLYERHHLAVYRYLRAGGLIPPEHGQRNGHVAPSGLVEVGA
jgi:hypothetical protein